MRYAVIMAGGSGTRLWPMSTAEQPKQLIPFIDGRSLLAIAAERMDGLVEPANQCVCTGEAFREPIRKAMPRFSDKQIHGEPIGRDTLNAVGFSAAVLSKADPDAVIATFTADHLIEPIDTFQERVNTGYAIAERYPEALVTFGIKPTWPATGYGYVQIDEPLPDFDRAFAVRAFKEKPDATTAQQYVDSGQYLWNSGMFVWRASALLGCIEKYQPEVYPQLLRIADAWGTPDQQKVLNEIYPALPKISVDYAIMEPASQDHDQQVATVEMPVQWLDVGSWTAFGQTCPTDSEGNQVAADRTELLDTHNTLVASNDPDHLIATVGVTDLVIVHTPRATLVCPRDQEQRVKDLQKRVAEQHPEDA